MRRLKRGVPVGLFLLVAFFYPLLAPTAHRIDEAHFEQISAGMTLEEVESRFGAPAGSYDWAVPKDPSIMYWDVASGLEVKQASFPTITSMTVNRASDDSIVWDIRSAQASERLYTRIVDFTVKRRSGSRTWTSRHGASTIFFDENNRVTSKSWGETRLEPPWHDWRKWFSK